MWAASNITYLYIVLGGTLVLLGLNVWQALGVVVAGNLFWVLVGWLSISGPSSGTPSEVVTRAIFGMRGNRVFNVVLGWIVGVAYEAINLSVGALAGFALVEQWGGHGRLRSRCSSCSHRAGHVHDQRLRARDDREAQRLVHLDPARLHLSCSAMTCCGTRTGATRSRPHYAVHGGALWAVAAAGFTIIASSPLSWGTGADYARYLPADVVPARGDLVDRAGRVPAGRRARRPRRAGRDRRRHDRPADVAEALLPGWFYPVFLLVIVAGAITNNVLTAYSTGLALQAVGIPWRRSVTVIFDAVVAVGITCYALFISNFLDTLNNILELTVAFLGPALAIYGDRHPAPPQPLQRARTARRDAGQPVLVLAGREPGRRHGHDRRHRGGAAVRQHQRAGRARWRGRLTGRTCRRWSGRWWGRGFTSC